MKAQVGHVVVLRALRSEARASDPALKKKRHEPPAALEEPVGEGALANGTLAVSRCSIEDVRRALRRYLQQYLALRDLGEAVPPEQPCVDVVTTQGEGGVAFTFCFVPGVVHDGSTTAPHSSASTDVHGADMRDTACGLYAARLPLPARLYFIEEDVVSAVCQETVTLATGTPVADEASRTSDDICGEPLLVVGAGGIGCELLKVLVLSGFYRLHIIDLDCIDATNLNRQFLFALNDVGRPKALTARDAVLRWLEGSAATRREAPPARRQVEVVAYHDNIKSPKFNDAFFRRFSCVLSALDNVSARQHVNRVCMRNAVPLVESGTLGYNGQVQPIVKGSYECYDCHAKQPDQQTFAVCTIHARPTTMVHCVHYAKELYETLFGERSDDAADAAGGGEMLFLRAVVAEWRGMTHNEQRAPEQLRRLGLRLVRCLFCDQIKQLLSMKSSWPTAPPVPLEDTVLTDLVLRLPDDAISGRTTDAGVRDVVRSVPETVQDFVCAVARCAGRSAALPFQKENDDTVDFVAATANLRASVFHIATQSVEAVRGIAGAIVPAIATTNALVAAGVVHELIKLLRGRTSGAGPQMIYVRKSPQTRRRQLRHASVLCARRDAAPAVRGMRAVRDHYLVHSAAPSTPNIFCNACQDTTPRVEVVVDVHHLTLRSFVQRVLADELGLHDVSLALAGRIVYEAEDYEALADQTLAQAAGVAERAGDEDRTLLFSADALNKDVPWQVAVRAASGAGRDAVVVHGMAQALADEALAVARQQRLTALLAAEEKTRAEAAAAHRGDKGLSREAAIDLADEDDGDDVEVL